MDEVWQQQRAAHAIEDALARIRMIYYATTNGTTRACIRAVYTPTSLFQRDVCTKRQRSVVFELRDVYVCVCFRSWKFEISSPRGE